jgi:hypothetical protein
MKTIKEFVKPGDVVLFLPTSPIGWAIAIKTWNREASHAEIVSAVTPDYVETWTARGGNSAEEDGATGANFYRDLQEPRRATRVTWILRPDRMPCTPPFNAEAAHRWAERYAVGQKYDYFGLLVFTLALRQGSLDRMFCSEATVNYSREGGVDPFNPNWPPDMTAPATFLVSPIYNHHRVKAGLVDTEIWNP